MMIRSAVLSAALAALFVSPAPAQAQSPDFQWRGSVAQGRSIEIKGINGDVRAGPAGGNEVEVVAVKTARRDDPSTVRIEVVPHAGGVTVCAVYPARDGRAANECAPAMEGA